MSRPRISLLALRRDPRLLQLPPILSACLVLVGVAWLLLLPLDEYSRNTYISENALLPGQVHAYFRDSEQNVFNAYRYEVQSVADKSQEEISSKLKEILLSSGLKVATQKYSYKVAGNQYSGENVYGVLHAPRGDATEAIVLVAAWTNMDGEPNTSGVALALTLTRYFKRWSLWSKDIVFLFSSDSRSGPQAWVEAYHDGHNPAEVEPLPLKSGALEGAIVIDHPLDHSFQDIHISYDGINGQLPNLDLFNTAVSIANGQHGIGASLQQMWKHDDTYAERLRTMLRGMTKQGLGHASGPHSCFVPYHVDAITIRTAGHGWQDNMALGRVVESLFRSLNNLMEHFHQSFFLYLLLHTKRFVSIGTYLPSAMLIAANFSIMAIALWIVSGRPSKSDKAARDKSSTGKKQEKEFEVVAHGGEVALIATSELAIEERHIFFPALLVASLHFLGLFPLYVFNHTPQKQLQPILFLFTVLNAILPSLMRPLLRKYTPQQVVLLKCFSLLLLGMFLATLATVNFSLSFIIGLLSVPLSFVGAAPSETADWVIRSTPQMKRRVVENLVLQAFSPPTVLFVGCWISGAHVEEVLLEAAFGWRVWGVWTQVIVWCVWWPAWLAGSIAVAPALFI